jgi:hypothetical protein
MKRKTSAGGTTSPVSVLPARLPAFSQTLLTRQLALVKDGFVARYPHAWLVWEPGAWSVPRAGVDVAVADTKLPSGGEPAAPAPPVAGDAVCFALKAPPGASARIGRATDNELVVSDLTVSRLHARLEHAGQTWALVALSETKVTRVRGAELSIGGRVTLAPGDVVELGAVRLVFHDAASFRDRLAGPRPPAP